LRTEQDVSGTFEGDPAHNWVDISATEINSQLTIEGTLSIMGTVLSISGSFAMPGPNANTNWISIQSDGSGNLTMYISIVSANPLVGVMEVYAEVVPPSAGSDEQFTGESEPVLD